MENPQLFQQPNQNPVAASAGKPHDSILGDRKKEDFYP
jgi:hypothetical protein